MLLGSLVPFFLRCATAELIAVVEVVVAKFIANHRHLLMQEILTVDIGHVLLNFTVYVSLEDGVFLGLGKLKEICGEHRGEILDLDDADFDRRSYRCRKQGVKERGEWGIFLHDTVHGGNGGIVV